MALLLQLTQKLAHGFHALWVRYPNHSAKKDAEKAYGQVVTTPEIDAQVHRALDWQLEYWQSLEWYHPPYLATYLRKGRYLDDPPASLKPKAPLTDEQKRVLARMQSNLPQRVPMTEAQAEVRARLDREWGPK